MKLSLVIGLLMFAGVLTSAERSAVLVCTGKVCLLPALGCVEIESCDLKTIDAGAGKKFTMIKAYVVSTKRDVNAQMEINDDQVAAINSLCGYKGARQYLWTEDFGIAYEKITTDSNGNTTMVNAILVPKPHCKIEFGRTVDGR